MKTFYKLCSMLLCSAFLLGGCTKETQTDGGDPRPGDDSIAEVREVMMTLKSQLVLQKGATKANATAATTTKAETSIATAAENAISTLDVYVFGAESENGDYTFLERFAYRADSNDKLPKDAKELQPNTTGADGKETTALIKLKKGLFVKLYCIANDTTLVDPATDKVVKAADFTPITFTESEDGTPRFAAEGKPQESTFVGWHTRLLTATAKADTLVTPLAMAGACTTPIDLTSFDNSARVQVGFRLTRLVARFDINNKAGDSRFTIETVSMVKREIPASPSRLSRWATDAADRAFSPSAYTATCLRQNRISSSPTRCMPSTATMPTTDFAQALSTLIPAPGKTRHSSFLTVNTK